MKYHIPRAPVRAQIKTREAYLLTFEAPEIAQEAKPGQFVHIKTAKGSDPLLRRPLSICRALPAEGLVVVWYQAVGRGTALMTELMAWDEVDVVGPLGRGFDTEIAGEKVYLIGGGVGLAPLIFLGQKLAGANEITLFGGAKNAGLLETAQDLSALPAFWATEDGSLGHRGLVTELLKQSLEKEKPARFYSCGPHGMLAEVARLARAQNIPLQVSLESAMACGVGACLGCSCDKGSGREGYLKVCKDGPVFWDTEVNL
ncbi:MAG: dihydroorotate dehydrogenase electron transfer subunit [Clostridia bacterium]|jgi:dihydroorotate dehydrogenase electron transfer subunit|nr:dihydroorotate dehydrogenase electron transfer subunit [Clostridia bacterium]